MPRDSRLSVQLNPMLFSEALRLFNCPLSAEQTWSIAYSVGLAIKSQGTQNITIEPDYVYFEPCGSISFKKTDKETNINELLHGLGKLLFHALDYNLPVDEERGDLPELLEDFLDRLLENEDINPEAGDYNVAVSDDEDLAPDEGFSAGPEDILRPGDDQGPIRSFSQVIRVCYAAAVTSKCRKSVSFESAHNHYIKVCQAIYQEASDLCVFLDKVEAAQQALQSLKGLQSGDDRCRNSSEFKERDLEDLRSTEWARLWMQVMRQLRTGVTLKKSEERNYTPHEIVYEMTPYEVLMEDIRCKRYNLKKTTQNNISPKLRKDAHEIILDFIRSRPILKPVRNRITSSGSWTSDSSMKWYNANATEILTARDTMLNMIRNRPNLRHIQTPNYNRGLQLGRVVDIMKDGVKRYEGPRLLIRPSSIMNLDIEDVSCTEDEGADQEDAVFSDKNLSPVGKHQFSDAKPPLERNSKKSATLTMTKSKEEDYMAEYFKDPSLIPDSNEGMDSFCTIDAEMYASTDSGDDERDETPTPQASSLEDIVKEFSSQTGLQNLNSFKSNMDRSTSIANDMCNSSRNGNGNVEKKRNSRLSVGSFPEQFQLKTKSQLSASMGFKRNQLSTAGATDCHGGHRRDRSVGVPRGLQGGGGGGSGVSRMGWGAYGGSGRFKGGGRGSENSVVECKMCNEGVDGRDFLNLTVDEMMHIRQVLTKAELDNLNLAKDLLADVRSECVCFLCKTTRFNMFKKKFNCKFCDKSVCKSCCRSIQMPNTSLLKVPITILSPTPSKIIVSSSASTNKSRDDKERKENNDKCLTNANNRKHSQRETSKWAARRSSLVGTAASTTNGAESRKKSRASDLPLVDNDSTEDEDENHLRYLSSSESSPSSSGDETCSAGSDAEESIVAANARVRHSGGTPGSTSPLPPASNLSKISEGSGKSNLKQTSSAKPIVTNKAHVIVSSSPQSSKKNNQGQTPAPNGKPPMFSSDATPTNYNSQSTGQKSDTGFRRASTAYPRMQQSAADSVPNSSFHGNMLEQTRSQNKNSTNTLAAYGINATPASKASTKPKTQVCKSCHQFLKHVLHTNTCANYFSTARS